MTAERRDAGRADPPHLWPDYRSTVLRAPARPPVRVPYGPTELGGPSGAALFAARTASGPPPGAGADAAAVAAVAADLTRQHAGAPLGERIIVTGRVLDAEGWPVPQALVEVWQANAAGRYAHAVDQHQAPLDPNFTGAGLCLTDDQGRYRFVTIKPGAYPWQNHANAWRPAHVHFSVMGRSFSQRLVTQMYFPGDPLLAYDPIYQAVPDEAARVSLVASFDRDVTVAGWALGFSFDLTLGGRAEAAPP